MIFGLPEPKTPEERIEVKLDKQEWHVFKDGRYTGYWFGLQEGAEIMRLGLIALLKVQEESK